MTSLERVNDYTSLKSEPLEKASTKPSKEWPSVGSITFEDVSFSYDENLPLVLKNLTIEIKGGEKVGVVGRTGAGKSSLFQALFRIVEFSGKILIDGVNIQAISLHELRRKIAIIPVTKTKQHFF
jgi:ABC-type multidrug transport system fused ATPase/permease subunit